MRQFFLLIVIFPYFAINAQKTEKSYIMSFYKDGLLFFILPQPIFKTSNNIAQKDFIFDITYLTKNDSSSFTATYTTKINFPADSIHIQDSDGSVISTPLKMIFIDKKSSQWIYRVRFMVSFELLRRLYISEYPYRVYIVSNKNRIEYQYSTNEWKKKRKKMNEILDIIKINKE